MIRIFFLASCGLARDPFLQGLELCCLSHKPRRKNIAIENLCNLFNLRTKKADPKFIFEIRNKVKRFPNRPSFTSVQNFYIFIKFSPVQSIPRANSLPFCAFSCFLWQNGLSLRSLRSFTAKHLIVFLWRLYSS